MVPALTIVIPARNEAAVIARTIRTIRFVTRRCALPVEILVIDDHSIDETAGIAREAGARVFTHPRSSGYGHAITYGIEYAQAPRVTIMTADGSDDPWVLPIYAAPGALAFGDRWTRGVPIGYPRRKRLLNRWGNRWIAAQADSAYQDWTDPFKAYPTALAQRMLPLVNDMSAGLQLALRASFHSAYRVTPVRWQGRRAGQSKFRWQEPYYYWRTAWRHA